MNNIFTRYQARFEAGKEEEMSVQDYLDLCREDPSAYASVAERLLIATALLSARELEQRLGVRGAEDFLVWVDRPERFLFRIGISAVARPEAELLATLVHRYQEPTDARP